MLIRLFRYALMLCAVLFVLIYLYVALNRLNYPFELECNEGGILNQVERITTGQALFVKPTLEFTSFHYTPLYYYFSAAAQFCGSGFVPLRLVSVLASLLCFVFIFLIVRHESSSSFSATIACGLFAASYPKCGAWFDIARVDSLYLCFLLAAVYYLRQSPSIRITILAGVMISLSFLSKQTAVLIALPVMLHYFLFDRRQFFLLTCTTILMIGSCVLLLNQASNSWFSYYAFEFAATMPMPGQNSMVNSLLLGFWTKDLRWLYLALLISLFYLFASHSSGNKSRFSFYFLFFMGMIAASWVSRLNLGGYTNGLFSAYAAISILFGLGVAEVFHGTQFSSLTNNNLAKQVTCSLCLVQFGLLIYNPVTLIPTAKDNQAGWELVETIKWMEGDVFIPHHSYLAVLAGKSWYLHYSSLLALTGGFGGGFKKEGHQVIGELNDAIRRQRFSAIILDFDPIKSDPIHATLNQYYSKSYILYENSQIFLPVTGARSRPTVLFLPQ